MRGISLLSCVILTACAGRPSLDQEKLSNRDFDLEVFFSGKTVANGQFQDLFGNVSSRFVVDIDGTWDGKTLKLVEDFTYDDKTKEQRVWELTKTGPETWQGTAPGVIGVAKGVEAGDTFNWTYTIDLPVRDGTVRVSFDDWMWLLSEDRVLNKAYMKRFGITVGEVTIMFEKIR